MAENSLAKAVSDAKKNWGKVNFQTYESPGPVATAYIEATGPNDIIMGPGGSGKTVASCYKCNFLTTTWFPISKDGWIRTKFLMFRDTYRNLARTGLASWYEMFPIDHPFTYKHSGGGDRPVEHILRYQTYRSYREGLIPVELIMQFNAVGDNNLEQFCRGYELSGYYANECDTLRDERTMGLMYARTGRYPPLHDIAEGELARVLPAFKQQMLERGIDIDKENKGLSEEEKVVLPRVGFADLNPPDIDNYVCRITGLKNPAEKNVMFNLYRQPSGLAPNAENRKGRPKTMYLLEEKTFISKSDVQRFVYGQPSYTQDGVPVYEGLFNLDIHRAPAPLEPVKELPLSIGMDAGGSPAAVIGQFMPNGQRRVLRELCTEPGTGPTRFATMLMELLQRDFAQMQISEIFADPSSFFGGDKVNGEFRWVSIVANVIGHNISPTDSNETGIRQEAVRWYLTGMIDGHTPRYLVDPRCARLISGFMAHYKLTKQASEGATNLMMVVKNEYSHIHDAEQYACLGHKTSQGVINDSGFGSKTGLRQRRPTTIKSDFNVFGV